MSQGLRARRGRARGSFREPGMGESYSDVILRLGEGVCGDGLAITQGRPPAPSGKPMMRDGRQRARQARYEGARLVLALYE
jgi:hypothetical protein